MLLYYIIFFLFYFSFMKNIYDRYIIIQELDHFKEEYNNELTKSLRGYYSKNHRDARVIHTIFENKIKMRKLLIKCLKYWLNNNSKLSGKCLGKFVDKYLYYEPTPKEIDNLEFKDINGIFDIKRNNKQKSKKNDENKDPLNEWKKKAWFRRF